MFLSIMINDFQFRLGQMYSKKLPDVVYMDEIFILSEKHFVGGGKIMAFT